MAGSGKRQPSTPAAKDKTAKEKKDERTESQYIVLRGVVLDFSADNNLATVVKEPQTREKLSKVAADETAKPQIAWLPVLDDDGKPKVFTTLKGKADAIEQHTGKAPKVGEYEAATAEDAAVKVGMWKAVSGSAWKGGITLDPPKQVTMFGRSALDE
jgi:hypothetical protein